MLLLGFLARRALTSDTDDHVPTKLQLFWETIVGQVNTQVEDNLGTVHPYVAPLAISLFFFILFANWLELLPTELNHDTPPAPVAHRRHQPHLRAGAAGDGRACGPTASATEGCKGYFKHFVEPFPVLLPLNILEELHQAAHAGAATLRQHLRRRHHARPDRGLLPAYVPVGAPTSLVEAVRHGHRRHPGLHLRPADRPLLRDGRRRHDEHDDEHDDETTSTHDGQQTTPFPRA